MNKCSSRLVTKPDTTKNLIKSGKGQSKSAALVFPCHPLLRGYRQLDLASSSSITSTTSSSTSSTTSSKTSCNSSPVEKRIPKALNCSQSSLLSPFSQSVNLSPVNRQVPYPHFFVITSIDDLTFRYSTFKCNHPFQSRFSLQLQPKTSEKSLNDPTKSLKIPKILQTGFSLNQIEGFLGILRDRGGIVHQFEFHNNRLKLFEMAALRSTWQIICNSFSLFFFSFLSFTVRNTCLRCLSARTACGATRKRKPFWIAPRGFKPEFRGMYHISNRHHHHHPQAHPQLPQHHYNNVFHCFLAGKYRWKFCSKSRSALF